MNLEEQAAATQLIWWMIIALNRFGRPKLIWNFYFQELPHYKFTSRIHCKILLLVWWPQKYRWQVLSGDGNPLLTKWTMILNTGMTGGAILTCATSKSKVWNSNSTESGLFILWNSTRILTFISHPKLQWNWFPNCRLIPFCALIWSQWQATELVETRFMSKRSSPIFEAIVSLLVIHNP